ncbi:MAG: hypothetical protein NTU61_03445 [Candidatus Altiarchaeota archaeon]|nr:hypothetical protein [Candidatus Altiarchaeota archaeon]
MIDKPLHEKKYNEEVDVEEKLSEGGILAKMFIEVQGNDKNMAKKALEKTVKENLLKEPKASVLEVRMFDLQKYETDKKKDKGYFSGVAEVKIVADNFPSFVNVVMRYGPTAIEITNPDEVRLDYEQMHALVSDVSALAQVYSNKIMTMLKDPERRLLYDKMLGEKDNID